MDGQLFHTGIKLVVEYRLCEVINLVDSQIVSSGGEDQELLQQDIKLLVCRDKARHLVFDAFYYSF